MHVGVCRIRFRLPESGSLKDKRRVVKSITSRASNKFNVSVAEVDDLNSRQSATIGISCVSNDPRHANEILSKVADYISDNRFEIEILDYNIEILPVFDL
ncbi:MAG: DUF503 domain-containing protein [Dehalococcoidales bacterium]|jgi:hypothetical protein|nr:hypothetical protein [Dehalococcoidales bacterium]MDP6126939.1 DUF503 domain-containing protein [Dehalococcoidales bacterium]MDP7524835.1 DUF503 domain-containing protein [Dehalococcoidales bacterium]|tara:strand:+ start:27 stop:326 length:300 start_codon:yes stop_codon:yes gene_type:complete